jgi:hypothetical protein
MKFTVVFASSDSTDLSYGLVFIPCPAWVRGDRVILNLNPENPHYQPGSVRKLITAERIGNARRAEGPRACTVVIHPEGHGSWPDLQALVSDLISEGLRVTLAGGIA